MNAAARMAAFWLVVAVVFGGAWAFGRAAGPVGAETAGHTGGDHTAGDAAHADGGDGRAHGTGDDAPAAETGAGAEAGGALPGLAAEQNGYTLAPETAQLDAGTPGSYRFRIVDATGAAVTRFAVEHEKRLHLIVVRRDGVHFQHVHPDLAADGTWTVPLVPPAAGGYRVFADFRPDGGPKTTLGVDLHVPGDYRPSVPAAESREHEVAGYRVRLDGDLTAGTSSTVRAVITKDGRPVETEPYLGAAGHLVALRASDLAYLHVHPDEHGDAGSDGHGHQAAPAVAFAVEVPAPGRYRLFLDFKHDGQVRTAEFTVDAAGVRK